MDLDTLKSRVSVADLFRADGKRLIKCPLPGHQDKTASLSIDTHANLWSCFGCMRGGSAVDFFVHMEGLDVPDAIKRLAEHAGVELDPLTPEQEERVSRNERRERCLTFATSYFRKQLIGAPLEYLQGRGFTAETIEALQIGFDDKALGWYVQKHGGDQVTVQDFIDCGLLRQTKGRLTDFLGGRIVFPVVAGGRVRTLTARGKGEGKGPKYLHLGKNDKEGNPLPLGAGLDWLYLEDNLRRGADVILCEGPPDTITLHQWGQPAVGLLGVGGIRPHATKFKGKAVYIAFDGDAAGERGVAKAGQFLEEAGAKSIFVIRPPAGVNDWNDWMLGGATAEDFEALKAAAPTYLSAMIQAIDPAAIPEVRGNLLLPIWAILARRSPAERDSYINQISDHLKITRKACRDQIAIATKRLEEEARAKAGSAAILEDELVYEDRPQLVPALDFAFNSPATATTTVYIPTWKTIIDERRRDAEPVRELVDEPYLVSVTIVDGQRTIKRVPVAQAKLNRREEKRIPHAHVVKGRWRLEGKHPYSIKNFLAETAPALDVPKLFDDIKGLFKSYLHLQDERDFDLLAVWVFQSYVYPLFNAIGYLWLHGPRASGKSTIAAFLTDLCFNAKRSSSLSESVLFRTIEANRSTMMIDEAEKLKNPDPKSQYYNLSLLCNDGYKAGAIAERVEPDANGVFQPVAFDSYSPKVFACIEELNFVLASRCIRISAETASAEEVAGLKDVSQNSHRLKPVFADLRDRLYVWTLRYFAEVHQAYTEIFLEYPDVAHIRGREREMWLPLISIAAHIDDQRYGEAGPPEGEVPIWERLVELQRDKASSAKAREGSQRLDLFVLSTVFEVIRDGDLGPMRIGEAGKGDFFITKDVSEIVTERAREAGIIGPDKVVSPRMAKGFLMQLGAIDDLEQDRMRDGNGQPRKVIQVDQTRLKSAMQRYGASTTDGQ